jgi:RNA polymerase sigma-70 factor, ECF subfamily
MRPTRDTSQLHQAKTPQPREAVSSAPESAPPNDDFGELIAAAQSGKTDALERLLASARPRLLALAMRVLGDVDEAEDAVQDAMIKVWRHLGRFEGRAAFTTWLHRIAVNAALDRRRRRSAVAMPTNVGGDDDRLHAASDQQTVTETPERIYARAETAIVVRGAMARLSSVHGEALRLCDLEGESYATIAAETDCPLGTVMSRLYHARRNLARELTTHAADTGDLEALRAA